MAAHLDSYVDERFKVWKVVFNEDKKNGPDLEATERALGGDGFVLTVIGNDDGGVTVHRHSNGWIGVAVTLTTAQWQEFVTTVNKRLEAQADVVGVFDEC